MATKKGTPLSARDALAAVRQAAMALTEDLKSARQQRQALEDELNGLLNKPLSKVALIQFLERRTDAAADQAVEPSPRFIQPSRAAGWLSRRRPAAP